MDTYKITKSIRFKVEPKSASILLKKVEDFEQNFDLTLFISRLHNFMQGLKEYLFKPSSNNTLHLKGDFTIKKEWIKAYAKEEISAIKAREQKSTRKVPIKISDLLNAKDKIIQAVQSIENTYKELTKDVTAELNERAKRERTGLLLKRLQARENLPLLFSLMNNIDSKSETSDLRRRLISLSNTLEKELLQAIAQFLPSQSNGIPVAKASFNYFTINKKPIDFKQKITEQLNQLILKKDINSILDTNPFRVNKNIEKKIKNGIQEELNKLSENEVLLMGDIPPDVPYDASYASFRQILKNIKATQKAKFNELMTKKETTLKTITQDPTLYLFYDIKNEFQRYKALTQELEQIATELSKKPKNSPTLRIDKQKKAKERGSIIKDKLENWKKFMNLYRSVAQRHGRILATLKGIEKEQIESQLLSYWAVILQVNGQYKLLLIPREKAQEVYNWIKNNKEKNSQSKNEPYTLYWLESFTYRSLQKLCFGHVENGNNEFNKNIQDILKDNGEPIKGEFSFQGDEQKKINFYKKVLKHPYTKKTLNLPFEQIEKDIINKKFATLDEFQIALEKIAYKRYALFLENPESILQRFDAQIFDITSLDLTRKVQQGKLKSHTQIWKEFWSTTNEQNHFDIRLNPEITLTYRKPKSSRIAKYGEKSSLHDPTKKNRYLYPQFTLVTTMSEHSNNPTKNLAFLTDEEFIKSVEKFNEEIKKEKITFALGIDNGEVELSTLGIYLPDFDKSTPQERLNAIQNVQKYGFDVLTIKNLAYSEIDYQGKARKIVQNPSYFLIKENYMRTFGKTEQEYEQMFKEQFEKKRLLSLDLSTAKVIGGHIVTNGDVAALLNLWLRHAERNLYEMNDHTKQETAKKIVLESQLNDQERLKFAEKISEPKKFNKLSHNDKERYIQWIFEDRNIVKFTQEEDKKFKEIQERKGNFSVKSGVVYALSTVEGKVVDITDIFDIRNVFKKREEFFVLKSEEEIIQELQRYNTNRTSNAISNEELDLRLTHLKEALVANAIGVIDFLYKEYKQRLGGEGLIIKEGFDTKKISGDIDKFSGNIYRILERKLYQKFQNYGLVPPIKSLLSIRNQEVKGEDKILSLGNIAFVAPDSTSQECPQCLGKTLRHTKKCPECNFTASHIMHSNDAIAAYNIAKRGLKNFYQQQKK